MTENPSSTKRDNRKLMLGGAAVVVAIITAIIGYAIGTTTERNVADDELTEANSTLRVVQVEATNAIDALGTSQAAVVQNYESTLAAAQIEVTRNFGTQDAQSALVLSTLEAEATNAVGTLASDSENALATIERQSTVAVAAITSTVAAQESSTTSRYQTETAIASSYTSTPSIPEGAVRVLSVPVRLGPGTEFPVIATLTQDTPVQILGFSADGDWIEISYLREDEPEIGFVLANTVGLTGGTLDGVPVALDFPTLTAMPSPVPTSTFEPSPTPAEPQAVVSAVRATVYSGPGDYFSVVGTLGFDVEVTVRGVTVDGQWLQIETTEISGFVRADALRFTGGPTDVEVLPTSSPTPQITPSVVFTPTPSTPQAVAAGQFVVVRSGPSEAFDVLGVVSADESLEIVGISRDGLWFRVVYTPAADGFGWVSGQVIQIAGNVSGVPAVDGPTLVEPTGSDASSSAGATTSDVSTGVLPEVNSSDYAQLDLSAYSYEVAVAINGSRDNQTYETFLTYNYAEDSTSGNVAIQLDANGGLLETFASNETLAFWMDFVPLTIGLEEGRGYFYSGTDDSCFELGADLTPDDLELGLSGFASLSDLSLLDQLPENAVFGELEDGGLVGLGGNHYQLLGLEEGGEIVPFDDFKVDLWYSEDNSVLYGYRITLNITTETYFLFRDVLVRYDPEFANVSNFEGSVTLYLLPRSIEAAAVEQTQAPSQCTFLD